MAYLDSVNSPDDIKSMSFSALAELALEIRAAILQRNSRIGGHVGSNLGVVEITLALHYVFHAPRDKIIFDVSHQSYAHKILTGRKKGFLDEAEYSHISGFFNPNESVYDGFYLGHTSTSISLAAGLAKARDLRNEQHNVIAVIGDGALSGGEAYEGLNFAGSELKSNLIVVVNDNEMSIAENHGGLYDNLRLLRETNGQAQNNFFKALGFQYQYVEAGHDIATLVAAFNRVKNCSMPTVVHIHTKKGRGYLPAEQNKEAWHKHLPFDVTSGTATVSQRNDYHEITFDDLDRRIKCGENLAVITAGMPSSVGLIWQKRQLWGENFLGGLYIDVGIAEEHAVSLASAMAKGGIRAVFCVGSSFIQRCYDQLSQDLALNKSPAVILVYGGGIADIDVTHLGVFDMAMMRSIPNLCYFAPAFYEEYKETLHWALAQTEHPVVIRVPKGKPIYWEKGKYHLPEFGRNEAVCCGSAVALITDGHSYRLGKSVLDELRKYGIFATHINAHYMSNVDEERLKSLMLKHQIVVTIEDGVLNGGYGEQVARFYGDKDMYVLCYGAKKEFTNRVPMTELLEKNRLIPQQILDDIMALMKRIPQQKCAS